MDTRFWGPSGWKLLHLIAASPVEDPTALTAWFDLLPYVLPCKYCRASLQEYFEEYPLRSDTMADPTKFSRWMYDLHNLVNEKLRGQGLLKTTNPTWNSVHNYYKELSKTLCDEGIIGWDFFASIAYTTPTKGIASLPSPIPANFHVTTLADKNRYNLLSAKERIAALKKWWALIPSILPCPNWRNAWSHALCDPPPLTKGRGPVSCWLWALEESACSSLKCPTVHKSLPNMKHELSAFESACGAAKKRKTCRTRRASLRRAVMTRRRQKTM